MTDPTPTPTPTPHRATPEQWAEIMRAALGSPMFHSLDIATANALLQHNDSVKSLSSHLAGLAARVEALEAQQAQPSQPAAPAEDAESGLVEQVAGAIAGWNDPPEDWLPEARAAIRAVARWLRDELHGLAADRLELELYRLEQEAGR